MKAFFVYPGSFCPPTYGHLHIVRQAAEIMPELHIICSRNPDKSSNWFTEEECVKLWKSYDLPTNVTVHTFAEFISLRISRERIVMVRGARNETDLDEEKRVLLLNWKSFGIGKYFYIMSKPEFAEFSSSQLREAAEKLDLRTMGKYASPTVITALLEKVLKVRNVFLVVGRPGSGKSTFLKEMIRLDSRNVHIDTDQINHELKPVLEDHFQESLIQLAIKYPERLKEFIATPWFSLLSHALKKVPADSRVFIEIPYGMQTDKQMFKYVGGNVLYIGCENTAENAKRIISRGTPEHLAFIERIPDLEATTKICLENRLHLTSIDTSGGIDETLKKANEFNDTLNQTDGDRND